MIEPHMINPQRKKEWRERNPKKQKAYERRYRRTPERIAYLRQYYLDNKPMYLDYRRYYYAAIKHDPIEYKLFLDRANNYARKKFGWKRRYRTKRLIAKQGVL